jgi:hypothetical protein
MWRPSTLIKRWPISADHGSSDAHCFARRLAATYKDTDFRHASSSSSYGPAMPTWRQQKSESLRINTVSPSPPAATQTASSASCRLHPPGSSPPNGRSVITDLTLKEDRRRQHSLTRCDTSFARRPTGAPCLGHIVLLRATTCPITAHSVLQIGPFQGPQHLTGYRTLCLLVNNNKYLL